jgi:hypothetical protein
MTVFSVAITLASSRKIVVPRNPSVSISKVLSISIRAPSR